MSGSSDVKVRRVALGWSRAVLAERAQVDPRTLQLIELGLSEDGESEQRCVDALAAAEAAQGGGNAPDAAGGEGGA